MMSKGFNKYLDSLMEFHEGGVFSKVLVKSDTYNHTLMCLAKGTDIGTHTSSKAGVVLVLKGKGNFKLFGEDIGMKPGMFIYMPANAPHSLSAEDDLAILLYLGS